MSRHPSPSISNAKSETPPVEEIQMTETKPQEPENTETHDFASPKSPTITFDNLPQFRHGHHLELPQSHELTEVFSNTFSEEEEERQFSTRPRSMSHHLSAKDIPSRSSLTLKANWWRALMGLGMTFHGWSWPRPPKPAFKYGIETDTEPIELYFYLPPIYEEILQRDPSHRFPAVINFHGGGFCLGDAQDDRYWARVVLQHTNCIFISVNYRRAPEQPFPQPVDDCVEAILYVADHADEMHIDPSNIALSGFSAGANLAFTAPLRLAYHRKIRPVEKKPYRPQTGHSVDTADTLTVEDEYDHGFHHSVSPIHSATSASHLLRNRTSAPLKIVSIIAWYPLLDWTMSRSRKIRESRNPQKCLSKTFTDLFDFSYLPAPDMAGDHCSPYASPSLAPDDMLRNGLPRDIQMWLCEWDMLLREGQLFADRLDRLGKRIDSKMIPQVPHAWDKSPNPFRDQRAIDALYTKASINLHKVFSDKDGLGPFSSMSSLHPTDPIIRRQPRNSVVLPV